MADEPAAFLGVFRADHIPDLAEPQLRRAVQALDGQDQSPAVRRLRAWALEAAAPTTGERFLDVGSGTGTVVRLLESLGGPGSAVGVEPNPGMRALAEARGTEAGSMATFVDGTVQALPYDDATFDLVWCERVLQHVADSPAAVAEIARVLVPDGRAVVLDSDHGTRILADVDPDVQRAVLDVFLASTPNPRAALHLPRQLAAAGLRVDPDIGSAALVMSPQLLASPLIVGATLDQAVAAGAITQSQADEASAVVRQAVADGVAFSAVTVFGFLARKPA